MIKHDYSMVCPFCRGIRGAVISWLRPKSTAGQASIAVMPLAAWTGRFLKGQGYMCYCIVRLVPVIGLPGKVGICR